MGQDMKLFKVITVLISLFMSSIALSDNNSNSKPIKEGFVDSVLKKKKIPNKSSTTKETKGHIGEMPPAEWWGEELKYSMPAYLWRRTQYLGFFLKKEEQKMHKSAVFFVLENAKDGQIVSWHSKKRQAAGKVRVIHSYPISGGYCRTYQTYIKVKRKARHKNNNACKYIGSPSWSFYR